MAPRTDSRNGSIYDFQHPSVRVRLALGRKRKGWYLILARGHGESQTREVVRLDKPGLRRNKADTSHPRFSFDARATSGWERKGQSLLQLLLSLDPHDPPVLALASSNTVLEEKWDAREVEVLIPDHRLAHWCEGCGSWEAVDSSSRWTLVRSGKVPGYLCALVGSSKI